MLIKLWNSLQTLKNHHFHFLKDNALYFILIFEGAYLLLLIIYILLKLFPF